MSSKSITTQKKSPPTTRNSTLTPFEEQVARAKANNAKHKTSHAKTLTPTMESDSKRNLAANNEQMQESIEQSAKSIQNSTVDLVTTSSPSIVEEVKAILTHTRLQHNENPSKLVGDFLGALGTQKTAERLLKSLSTDTKNFLNIEIEYNGKTEKLKFHVLDKFPEITGKRNQKIKENCNEISKEIDDMTHSTKKSRRLNIIKGAALSVFGLIILALGIVFAPGLFVLIPVVVGLVIAALSFLYFGTKQACDGDVLDKLKEINESFKEVEKEANKKHLGEIDQKIKDALNIFKIRRYGRYGVNKEIENEKEAIFKPLDPIRNKLIELKKDTSNNP